MNVPFSGAAINIVYFITASTFRVSHGPACLPVDFSAPICLRQPGGVVFSRPFLHILPA